ncbi:MAG: hypothetical protein ACJAZ9_000978 [Neolewinella sp.]
MQGRLEEQIVFQTYLPLKSIQMPNVVMMGATGAVGGEAVKQMLLMPEVTGLTLLGRRDVESFAKAKVAQHKPTGTAYCRELPWRSFHC